MSPAQALPPAPELHTYGDKIKTIAAHIREQAERCGAIDILEAGCGTRWDVNLRGVRYTLTGIDNDQAALDLRLNCEKDMDRAILGDLRTVELAAGSFDVIFCNDVLEHVAGAETVLANFARWLRPGGIMILGFPNRDSSYAFLTRITPHRAHVWFKKYVQGFKTAGQPGCAPFPTVFDPVVSRTGLRRFAASYGLVFKAEYRRDAPLVRNVWLWRVIEAPLWLLHAVSGGRLSMDHRALLCVIEKPG